MEIFKANRQWSTRPDDERFCSLEALYAACKAYAATAHEKEGIDVASLRVENVDGDVQLVGKGGQPARLTHWAFGQLCARVGAPASYLRDLPATLAAQNLNHGLAQRVLRDAGSKVNMLFHLNGSLLARALTSEKYERIWNWEVGERLVNLQRLGWEPATPDIRRKSEDVNDPQNYSLYASDHDLFAFIRNTQRTINEPGNPDGLQRGLIVENSEVGASRLRLLSFLYREMCGNHIIWGAENVLELSAVHVGNVRDRMSAWKSEITRYMDSSASVEEAKIAASKTRLIAATKEEVLDAIFGKRSIGLSRKALEASYTACVADVDGDPRTPWGLAQGVTRASQELTHADKRTELDRAAGRILEAF